MPRNTGDCYSCGAPASCRHDDDCAFVLACQKGDVVAIDPDTPFVPFVVDQPPGGHPIFLALTDEMKALHQLKSGGYGTGTDPFANFTQVAAITGRERAEYPLERIVEKITRARSLIDQGRWDEVGEELLDVAGLALCAEAMRREDAGTPDGDPRHPKVA